MNIDNVYGAAISALRIINAQAIDTWSRIPISDFSEPRMDDFQKVLHITLFGGDRFIIFCKSGCGRTSIIGIISSEVKVK